MKSKQPQNSGDMMIKETEILGKAHDPVIVSSNPNTRKKQWIWSATRFRASQYLGYMRGRCKDACSQRRGIDMGFRSLKRTIGACGLFIRYVDLLEDVDLVEDIYLYFSSADEECTECAISTTSVY
jgi:hypothetical protein